MNCLKPRALKKRMKDLIRFDKDIQLDKRDFNLFMQMLAKKAKQMENENRANNIRDGETSEEYEMNHVSRPVKHYGHGKQRGYGKGNDSHRNLIYTENLRQVQLIVSVSYHPV